MIRRLPMDGSERTESRTGGIAATRTVVSRRRPGPVWLRLCLVAAFASFAAFVLVALPAAAQESGAAPPRVAAVKQITSDLYFFFDYDGSNAVFLVTDDGVLVIDTRQHPRAGQDLINRIRQVTDQPIKWVINSHFHGDHTFGNAAFQAAGGGRGGGDLTTTRHLRGAKGNCSPHATGSAQGDGAPHGLLRTEPLRPE
jgi:glyoxylase-like metal-dependent hydrolase (beta-lactamase superfamily II)